MKVAPPPRAARTNLNDRVKPGESADARTMLLLCWAGGDLLGRPRLPGPTQWAAARWSARMDERSTPIAGLICLWRPMVTSGAAPQAAGRSGRCCWESTTLRCVAAISTASPGSTSDGSPALSRTGHRRALYPDGSLQAMQIYRPRPSSMRAADPVADLAREFHCRGRRASGASRTIPRRGWQPAQGRSPPGRQGPSSGGSPPSSPRGWQGSCSVSCASRRSSGIGDRTSHGLQSRGPPLG